MSPQVATTITVTKSSVRFTLARDGGGDDQRQPDDEGAHHDAEGHVLVHLDLLVHVEGHHQPDDPEAHHEDHEPHERVHHAREQVLQVHQHAEQQHHLPP